MGFEFGFLQIWIFTKMIGNFEIIILYRFEYPINNNISSRLKFRY